ncbi:hypothetical protein BCR41DRAFT_369458 [Lobosporangium transversale]|uniref:EF-hand n=1 Tax=Lobosporangium transversale TaxID=64571 RepID=A0A1Y2GRU9_9FUNG|nr:hypothetical protein BCR41DRAFT_369458 [Lobosporangium transversale]ORZ20836.1 hypothetical protein BCR41DRAFT_369458 [Lobosporangium transversale]|eukprot:XP_021882745.1 hypothetical protein BCR41DRAFT_369458 [Lobosporangium transversale]
MDDFGDSKHDGLQLMNLLYAIAEDQASKEGHIHRGITCNSCRTVPIRGLRYKCANCQDYDLCEGCEAAEVHIRSHVFMKIRIPIPPLANSRTKKLPPFYPGIPQGNVTTPDHLLQQLLETTHFDNVELDAMYNQYLSLSTLDQEGGGITRLTFEQALGPLGLEKNLITDRIFHFFDQDNDGVINFKEMACGLSVLCKGNVDEKIDYAFQGYDLDGDGYISREELHEMFKAYFYLSMELIRDVVKTMENDIISNFEYQPGIPISSTFTAPIPREIGARSNNGNNGNNTTGTNQMNGSSATSNDNNNNSSNNNTIIINTSATEEVREVQEQVSLPADRSHSLIPNGESSSAIPNISSIDGTSHGTARHSVFTPEEMVTTSNQEYEEVREISNQNPAIMESTLSSGSYGFISPDTYINQGEDSDDDEAGTSVATDGDTEKSHGNESETLLSPQMASQELPGDSSEGEDSGVDNSGWLISGAVSSPTQQLYSNNMSRSTSSQDTGDVHASSNSSLPPRLDIQEGSSAESSSSQPRKDQPLPPMAPSSHAVPPNISNTNFAWDHPQNRPSSSTPHSQSSQRTPSLVPSPALGFGLSQPSTSSSPLSSATYLPSNHDPSHRPPLGAPYQSFASTSSATPAGSYANPSYFSSTFPVMESISQDAIHEMVDKTFNAIKNPSKPGYITLEEFRAYVLTDAGILGWFDALGSIF